MVVDGMETRGQVYYLRQRVPARFRDVEPRAEVNCSLETRCRVEARAKKAIMWLGLHREWEAALGAKERPGSREVFDGAMEVLREMNLPYRRVDQLAAGPVEEIVLRLETLADRITASAAVPALLGAVDLPRTLVSEMPAHYERIRADRATAKNDRQLREWRNKYVRAAAAFVATIGDKPMPEITAQDARLYRRYWEDKRITDGLTTQYVNKQLAYMTHMTTAFHEDVGLLAKDYVNPFDGLAFGKLAPELRRGAGRKLTLPVSWIIETLLDPARTAGLNGQALDIAIVCAVCGTREAEIIDLPPDAVILDGPVPHLRLAVVEEGEHRREIKNIASARLVPLLGHALDAMRRNPHGFPRYRGKATYYATINKFFREAKLFPEAPAGASRGYTIGGLRHAFEDRMKWAGIANEERALLMGHSLQAERGRPVYGAEVELELRALLMEKVAFATDAWTPRPHAEVDTDFHRVLREAGHRPS